MVWYGMVWYGMVWYGMVWYGNHGAALPQHDLPEHGQHGRLPRTGQRHSNHSLAINISIHPSNYLSIYTIYLIYIRCDC